VEQALCDVWQQVLNRSPIGVTDNFFSLGGDSILSIRVVSMLKSRGLTFSIRDIFRYQTIAQLAVRIIQSSAQQESPINTVQVTRMLISEGDQLDENIIETAL